MPALGLGKPDTRAFSRLETETILPFSTQPERLLWLLGRYEKKRCLFSNNSFCSLDLH